MTFLEKVIYDVLSPHRSIPGLGSHKKWYLDRKKQRK
jgi:hypothetical protein